MPISERDRYIVELHVEHRQTLTEIARSHDRSRERIRQIVRAAGVSPEVTREVQRAKARTVDRVTHACEGCGRERNMTAGQATNTHYCSADCYKLHARQYTDDDLLEHLRLLGADLERTPSQFDIQRAAPPSHATYYKRFGSLRRAQKLAGLTPNRVGGARKGKRSK